MVFLDPKLTRYTNRHVTEGPKDALPHFKHTGPSLVTVGGALLRYSSTTPAGDFEPVPGGYRREARTAVASKLRRIARANAAHE